MEDTKPLNETEQPAEDFSEASIKQASYKNPILVGISVVAVLALSGAGMYFAARDINTTTNDLQEVSQEVERVVEAESLDTTGWSSYNNTFEPYITLKYPSNAKVDHIGRLTLMGETQIEGTELYDGMVLWFEHFHMIHNQSTPEQKAEAMIAESKAQGVISVASAIEDVNLGVYEGVSYTTDGLGTNEYIILKDPVNGGLLLIASILEGPEAPSYEKLRDQILGTLEFKKIPEDKLFNDGNFKFILPEELEVSKSHTESGVPYLQLKTTFPTSIVVDIGFPESTMCIELISSETIDVNGSSAEKSSYKSAASDINEMCSGGSRRLDKVYFGVINVREEMILNILVRYEEEDAQLAGYLLNRILQNFVVLE